MQNAAQGVGILFLALLILTVIYLIGMVPGAFLMIQFRRKYFVPIEGEPTVGGSALILGALGSWLTVALVGLFFLVAPLARAASRVPTKKIP